MISRHRKYFNENFNMGVYDSIAEEIGLEFDHIPPFKICETPVFIPLSLKEKLFEASNELLSFINKPNFKELSKGSIIHPSISIPSDTEVSKFVQFDFGICEDEDGELIPKLIELQGFPSLYFYQDLLGRKYQEKFDLPDNMSPYPNGLKRDEYIEKLRKEIVGKTNPEQVVLLEVEPEKQATRIDFLCAEKLLGIKVLCISKMKKQGKKLFYLNELGENVRILKIYNRVIFDELDLRTDLDREFHFHDEVDVEWIGHPNWFFRISKYTMPLFDSKYVPKSYYLEKLEKYPSDLNNYVLKPLYSFAGSGVQLHVTPKILDEIKDRQNYILQEKVDYKAIIETLDEPAKCEVRIMALYNSETQNHEIICNLVRLSKGEMIGVKYNKDRTWVGGSIGFFENEDV